MGASLRERISKVSEYDTRLIIRIQASKKFKLIIQYVMEPTEWIYNHEHCGNFEFCAQVRCPTQDRTIVKRERKGRLKPSFG